MDDQAKPYGRRTVLKTIGASAIASTALSGAVTANNHCDATVSSGDSIQTAIDDADEGDTICVEAGTYQEQLVINKDLTLTNAPGDDPTVEAPSSPTQFTIPESGADFAPVIFAFGGNESGGDITGSGSVDVNISGITVDGRDRSSGTPVGILLRNVASSNGMSSVADNLVTRTFVESRTHGIGVHGGDAAVEVLGNEVEEYSRVGIFADGDEGPGVDPEVTIQDNVVRGPNREDGSRDLTWAPNGIQVSSGATGEVHQNTVDNNWGPGLGSGIIIVDSDEVSVKHNSLERNEVGIFFGKFFTDDPVGGVEIQHNDVFGGDDLPGESAKMDYGTYLYDSNDGKVVNNDYDTWDNGVLIYAGRNNKVVRNSFTDVDDEVIDLGDDTKNPDTPDPADP